MAQPAKRKDERTIYSVGGKRETPPVEKIEEAKRELKTEPKPTIKKTVAKKKTSAKKSKTSTKKKVINQN